MSDELGQLSETLARIDGRGYKAYKEIGGSYAWGSATLFIDHVQGDPFATPSKVRVRLNGDAACIPKDLYDSPVRRLAVEDYLARKVRSALARAPKGPGSGKSGLLSIDAGGQEVLERTAVVVTPQWVEARLYVGLPAAGRRVLGHEADRLLRRDALERSAEALAWTELDESQGRPFVECVENQESIRDRLDALGLVAFVADGSLLPRTSGASDTPMKMDDSILFRSPEAYRVTLDTPNEVRLANHGGRSVTGMGVPKGVTLIVGGGYHGKSTWLRALERGVYPHLPGDGREYVVTVADAVKIRAEDGRRIEKVDISAFISGLPYGKDTRAFSSDDASGSTSQAAAIMEAIETGTSLLLLDEDTCATNFMVRDARMQALVHKEDEPITPFLDRVRELYASYGVSTIVVMGGCGDYFDVADRVVMMRNYVAEDVTKEAKDVARSYPTGRVADTAAAPDGRADRIPLWQSFDPSRGRREVRIEARDRDRIVFGKETIDLRALEQLVDLSQTRAIGHAMLLAADRFMNEKRTLREIVDRVMAFLEQEGLDCLDPFYRPGHHPGDYAKPRKHELAAAMNRLRTLSVKQKVTRDEPD